MYFVYTVHDTNGVLRYRPNHKMPNSMVMSLSQCNWFVTDIALICIQAKRQFYLLVVPE